MLPDLLSDPLILAPPPRFAEGPLREVLARRFGFEGVLEPLGGERDRNFRLIPASGGLPLLVKLAHPDEEPAVTDFQTAGLLHLEAADPTLPVPRVLRTSEGATAIPHATEDGRPSLLRVLTYLAGRPMTDPAGASPPMARALGVLVARLDRALAGFAHPADGRRLVWDLREAPALRALLPDVADPALRALVAGALDRFEAESAAFLAAQPGQVIHNDLNPHNVLVEAAAPERLAGIIDFGDMVRAPRLQEVATTGAYLLRPGPDPLAAPGAFLAGYRSVLPLGEEEEAHMPALIATRLAMTVLITSWRARRQPENATYILRNQPGARAGLEWLMRRPLAPLQEE
jgi:Ser/Thr protein kinase RdoA (MazF antagonist)